MQRFKPLVILDFLFSPGPSELCPWNQLGAFGEAKSWHSTHAKVASYKHAKYRFNFNHTLNGKFLGPSSL